MKQTQAKRLPITYMGDEVLIHKTKTIDTIDEDIKTLAYDMLETMYAEGGCGLAAPQVGKDVRLCVIDVSWNGEESKAGEKSKAPYILVNPRILSSSEEMEVNSEGCLSFPGISVDVERPCGVCVEAENLNGETLRYEAQHTLLARCLQHEIDHLEGVTMLDHLSAMKRLKAVHEVNRTLHEEGIR